MQPAPRRLQRTLLAWYDDHQRALPWRGLNDPYAIWVSEVMLQQTRVEAAIPFFLRWMERFPTVQDLAAAPQDDVLRAWAGLGYYARARNLHAAARLVVAAHEGTLPRDPARLATLPGFGPYTTGAVASIAFGVPVPAVDGNVLRVLARLYADAGDVMAPATRRRLTTAAAALVPAARPGDWNQALMELGATVCVPRRPRCDACPWSSLCAARRAGRETSLPHRARRKAVKTQTVALALVQHRGRLLVVQQEDGLLQGLWGLPVVEQGSDLAQTVRAATGVEIEVGPVVGRAEHRFTHRLWQMDIHRCGRIGGRLRGAARWVAPAGLAEVALSTAQRKALGAAGVLAR